MFMNENEVENWHNKGMNLFWVSTELGMMGSSLKKINNLIKDI